MNFNSTNNAPSAPDLEEGACPMYNQPEGQIPPSTLELPEIEEGKASPSRRERIKEKCKCSKSCKKSICMLIRFLGILIPIAMIGTMIWLLWLPFEVGIRDLNDFDCEGTSNTTYEIKRAGDHYRMIVRGFNIFDKGTRTKAYNDPFYTNHVMYYPKTNHPEFLYTTTYHECINAFNKLVHDSPQTCYVRNSRRNTPTITVYYGGEISASVTAGIIIFGLIGLILSPILCVLTLCKSWKWE